MYIRFDKVDITPQRPCYMAGYNRPGMNESVLDSIQINSLCLSIDNETFVLVVLDSIMLDPVFCNRVKAGITSRTGIHPSHITVACIHTHSAPAYFKLAFEDTHVEPELTADAERRMIESACRAHAHMQPATCTFEKMLVDGLYGNRNVRGGCRGQALLPHRLPRRGRHAPRSVLQRLGAPHHPQRKQHRAFRRPYRPSPFEARGCPWLPGVVHQRNVRGCVNALLPQVIGHRRA